MRPSPSPSKTKRTHLCVRSSKYFVSSTGGRTWVEKLTLPPAQHIENLRFCSVDLAILSSGQCFAPQSEHFAVNGLKTVDRRETMLEGLTGETFINSSTLRSRNRDLLREILNREWVPLACLGLGDECGIGRRFWIGGFPWACLRLGGECGIEPDGPSESESESSTERSLLCALAVARGRVTVTRVKCREQSQCPF